MNPRNQPVAVQAAVLAGINLLQVLGAVHLSPDQVAAVNAVLVSVLGLVVQTQVTPNVKLGKRP